MPIIILSSIIREGRKNAIYRKLSTYLLFKNQKYANNVAFICRERQIILSDIATNHYPTIKNILVLVCREHQALSRGMPSMILLSIREV